MRYRLHMTQSLLSAWQRSLTSEVGYEELVRTLQRVRTPPTEAMLDGIRFENCVNQALDGVPVPHGEKLAEEKYFHCVRELAEYLDGSRKQVGIKKDIVVDGIKFELHGVLDFLKAGVIYDTKFSKNYFLNKYLDSPQHAMYFYLVPEARRFEYLICNGVDIFSEIYTPQQTIPIEVTIRQFMRYLKQVGLWDTYIKYWNMRTYNRSRRMEKKL